MFVCVSSSAHQMITLPESIVDTGTTLSYILEKFIILNLCQPTHPQEYIPQSFIIASCHFLLERDLFELKQKHTIICVSFFGNLI